MPIALLIYFPLQLVASDSRNVLDAPNYLATVAIARVYMSERFPPLLAAERSYPHYGSIPHGTRTTRSTILMSCCCNVPVCKLCRPALDSCVQGCNSHTEGSCWETFHQIFFSDSLFE